PPGADLPARPRGAAALPRRRPALRGGPAVAGPGALPRGLRRGERPRLRRGPPDGLDRARGEGPGGPGAGGRGGGAGGGGRRACSGGPPEVGCLPGRSNVQKRARGEVDVREAPPPAGGDPEFAPPDAFDPVVEAYKKDVDRTLLRENLKLTPE